MTDTEKQIKELDEAIEDSRNEHSDLTFKFFADMKEIQSKSYASRKDQVDAIDEMFNLWQNSKRCWQYKTGLEARKAMLRGDLKKKGE